MSDQSKTAATKGPAPIKKVPPAILGGIKKAQRDYDKMAGAWMDEGPEYWITTYVAKALWKLCGDDSVVVEGGSKKTLDGAGRKRGRPPFTVGNKRYDIVLYFTSNKQKARAVIEIKAQPPKNAVLSDVDRIVAALRYSELRFGAVGYFWSASDDKCKLARVKVTEHAGNLEEKAVDRAAENNFKATPYRYVSGDGCHAWLAGCIMVERKQGNKQRK